MPVTHVTALIPHRTLFNGRTSPLLADCVDQAGTRHDVVVKCFAPEDRGNQAAISDLVCPLLASKLRLNAPAPFIVTLPDSFLKNIGNELSRSRYQKPRPLLWLRLHQWRSHGRNDDDNRRRKTRGSRLNFLV